MKPITFLFAGALTALSSLSFADNINTFDYVGLSLHNDSYDDLDLTPGIDPISLSPLALNSDTSDSGYRIFVGHQFNRYFAVEAGLKSYGTATFSVTEATINNDGDEVNVTRYAGEFDTFAGDIRLNLTYPINEHIFIKGFAGLSVWDNQFETLVTDNENLAVQSTNDFGTSFVGGVGIGYGINKQFAITLDYETTQVASITSNAIGLSVLYRL